MNVRGVSKALASLFVLALAVPLFGSARIVRLSYVDGNVQIDRNKAAGVERAILNMPVTEGTHLLSVGDDSRIEVEFENGSTMRVAGSSEILFRQLGSAENGAKQSVIEVVHGVAYFDVKLHDDDDYRVLFRDRDVEVRKSSHFRVQVDDQNVQVAVYHGEVELEGEAEQVMVKKDETLTLNENDTRYFLAKNVQPLDWDQFDKDRNDYRNTYAKSNAYGYSGVSYGSPYSYGLNDMAYYGEYAYYPGYGYLWRPYGYGVAWDPFSYGAWSYYPQFGWMYVSSYPWGWTPYRYGEWINVPGYGWCWNPNGYAGGGGGWYPVPRYRPPMPPGPNGHGPIPVPVVRPPQLGGGPTVSVGGGGLTGEREPGDAALRPNPAAGPKGRPSWFGRRSEGPQPNGAVGPAATTPVGPAATTPVTPAAGAGLTSQGGAVTPQGGAVTPVVPGVGQEPPQNVRLRPQPNRWTRGDEVKPPAPAQGAATPAHTPARPMGVPNPPMRPEPAPRATPPPSAPPASHEAPAPRSPQASSSGGGRGNGGGMGRGSGMSSGFARSSGGGSSHSSGNSGSSHH